MRARLHTAVMPFANPYVPTALSYARQRLLALPFAPTPQRWSSHGHSTTKKPLAGDPVRDRREGVAGAFQLTAQHRRHGQRGKTYEYMPELEHFEDSHFAGTARSYGMQLKQPLFQRFRTKAETEPAEKQVVTVRAKLGSAEQQLFLDTPPHTSGAARQRDGRA